MKLQIHIPFKLPSLNEYTAACRGNRYAGAKMKKDIEVSLYPFMIRKPHFDCPVKVSFEWHEANRRRDLDNLSFSKKFILDALTACGILTDDSPKYVVALEDTFVYDNEYGVKITIEERTQQ